MTTMSGRSYQDFMCTCSDESRIEAEECYARVLKALDTEPGKLLNAVVYTLQWGIGEDFDAYISDIGCDMWCGVSVTVRRLAGPDTQEIAHIFVQCDQVEHGIARAFELCEQAVNDFKNERPGEADEVE